jgi:hypothetical protein
LIFGFNTLFKFTPKKGEIKMRIKTVLKLVVLFAVTFNWAIPAIGEMGNQNALRTSYEGMYEDVVKKTESKAKMSDSKSKNLRQAARIASLKANYFKNHKDTLVNEMIRRDIPLKSYRMRHFMSEQFYSDYASRPESDRRIVKVNHY